MDPSTRGRKYDKPAMYVWILVSGLLMGTGWAEEPYPYTSRGSTEWCNISIAQATSTNLPRVLLIGDSITGQYASEVGQALQGKVYLSVLATSKAIGDPSFLDEIKVPLRQNRYAVIHFNNGLHSGPEVKGYREGFPEVLATLKRYAPGAKFIWATTTPCMQKDGGPDKKVQEYNRIAAEFIAKEGLPVDDLYSLIANHTNKLWSDGTHYMPEGKTILAKQVTQSILLVLEKQP